LAGLDRARVAVDDDNGGRAEALRERGGTKVSVSTRTPIAKYGGRYGSGR
jgi:hypothetical protein